jgi:hypothetical protein
MSARSSAAKVILFTLTALGTVSAGTLQFTAGTPTGTASGSTISSIGIWTGLVSGNPAPFNAFNGSDTTTPDFSANWSFSYAPIVGTIVSATLELGIYDIDSHASGLQVASYLEGASNNLTSLLNAVSEALNGSTGAVNREYDILTINLPNTGTLFADLAGGTPGFSLALQGPGLGVLGETTNNGAGIDYSRLTIVTQDVGPTTPEPAAWTLMTAGAAALTILRRRRR